MVIPRLDLKLTNLDHFGAEINLDADVVSHHSLWYLLTLGHYPMRMPLVLDHYIR